MDTLRERCVDGITVNAEHNAETVRNSIGIVTALNPYIGYKNSTKIAKEALETGASVYDLVLRDKILTKEKLDAILDPKHMLDPMDVIRQPWRSGPKCASYACAECPSSTLQAFTTCRTCAR